MKDRLRERERGSNERGQWQLSSVKLTAEYHFTPNNEDEQCGSVCSYGEFKLLSSVTTEYRQAKVCAARRTDDGEKLDIKMME